MPQQLHDVDLWRPLICRGQKPERGPDALRPRQFRTHLKPTIHERSFAHRVHAARRIQSASLRLIRRGNHAQPIRNAYRARAVILPLVVVRPRARDGSPVGCVESRTIKLITPHLLPSLRARSGTCCAERAAHNRHRHQCLSGCEHAIAASCDTVNRRHVCRLFSCLHHVFTWKAHAKIVWKGRVQESKPFAELSPIREGRKGGA